MIMKLTHYTMQTKLFLDWTGAKFIQLQIILSSYLGTYKFIPPSSYLQIPSLQLPTNLQQQQQEVNPIYFINPENTPQVNHA